MSVCGYLCSCVCVFVCWSDRRCVSLRVLVFVFPLRVRVRLVDWSFVVVCYVCQCVCLCVDVCVFVCLSVCLCVCLSVCLSCCLSVCMYVCLSVYAYLALLDNALVRMLVFSRLVVRLCLIA